MSSYIIGLIAEDDTDCDTIRKIVHRLLGKNTKTKKWASNGCSHLLRKLPAQLKSLSQKGCDRFIIIHDLDRNPKNDSLNNEVQLRNTLKQKSDSISNSNKHICIPIEELEAWFWSDPNVIDFVGKGKGKAHPNPHSIKKPKEKLIGLSVGKNRKPRYSTNMNVELADMLDLDICSDRCPSFRNLRDFLLSL